jgi:Arm DNA-binding domain
VAIEYDGKIAGFGIRVTAAGAKSFVLNYRIDGRKRLYTIGSWPDEFSADAARAKAMELRSEIKRQRPAGR